MAKRIGIVFFMFVLCVGLLGLRMMRIPYTQTAQRSYGSMSLRIDESRGVILDRNGVPLVGREQQSYVAAKPTPAASLALRSVLSEERFRSVEERLARGNLVALRVEDSIPACDDLAVMDVFPRYSAKQPAVHVIGYLDGQTGAGISGIEKAFEPLLGSAAGSLTVRMAVDAKGNGLSGARLEIENDNYHSLAGVQLTIDAHVQAIAEAAMEDCGMTQGAVIVIDCATGDVLALASAPVFDPSDVAASLQDPLEPFFNRALGAYPIGSTFKCFVAAAALEQRIPESTRFTCGGVMDLNGQLFRCNNETVHGTVDLQEALAQSCNLYFIQLAQRLQQQPALDLMRLFGFGEPNALAEGITGARGNLPSLEELASKAELANFSFGQGKLLGTPLQMCAATACLVSNGVYHAPTLVKATIEPDGTAVPYVQDTETREVISPEIAAKLRQMMVYTVEQGTGRSAKPDSGGAGGKTATAQSGRYNLDGAEILQTGFTGFFPAEQPRYAVTVFRQNGTSGAVDCGPVFQRIASAMIDNGF